MNIHVESIMSQELNLRSLPGIYLIMCFTTQLISKLISIVHIVPTTTTELTYWSFIQEYQDEIIHHILKKK